MLNDFEYRLRREHRKVQCNVEPTYMYVCVCVNTHIYTYIYICVCPIQHKELICNITPYNLKNRVRIKHCKTQSHTKSEYKDLTSFDQSNFPT